MSDERPTVPVGTRPPEPAEPPEPPAGLEPDDSLDEEMPRVHVTRRMLALGSIFVVSIVAFLYFVLPQISGLGDTWHRIERGDPLWLVLALVFTVLSFGGYVLLFQGVFVRAGCPLTLAESYQITMAGLAATRLFAAGGAGGIALTAWALRRAGMPRREVADRTIAFLVVMYAVYMLALIVCGLGLYLGLLPGPDTFAMTMVPAIFAAVVTGITLLAALPPTDLQQRLEGYARSGGRFARLVQRAANLPAAMSAGVRHGIRYVVNRDPAIAGALAYWAFNIAILWASFRAFGAAPPVAVIVMGYFVGMLGNLLPLPGGVGGVDGGMIGAFIALGVAPGAAIVAVLTYRGFAFWLPTLPGAFAYLQLRRTVQRWREEREAQRARPRAVTAS